MRYVSHKVLLMQVLHHGCPLLDSRAHLDSPDQVPECFPPLKLQASPDIFVNIVKSFGEKNEEFGRTFFVLRASYF